MPYMTPKICPCCDRPFDDKEHIEGTDRVLYFHHKQQQTCITEKNEPVGTYGLGAFGIKNIPDFD